MIRKQIPLSKAMKVTVRVCEEKRVEFLLPIEENSNHLNTAFGGSVLGAQALCCWSWIMNFLDINGLKATVVIEKNESQFKRPIRSDFKVSCDAPSPSRLRLFKKELESKKKARIKMEAIAEAVSANSTKGVSVTATYFKGHYVVFLRPSESKVRSKK